MLPARTPIGEDYIECMRLAGSYAYAGRDWVCDRVAKILGANTLEEVHNHHNFAWREEHGGEEFWVVRKGATPAFPGQRGFVGGTMGDRSVILEGVENRHASESMYSTVHGAGRVMGRMEVKGKTAKDGTVKREPKVTRQMMADWMTQLHVELRESGVDESPHCYKRLPEVLAEHAESVQILHTLTPSASPWRGKTSSIRSRLGFHHASRASPDPPTAQRWTGSRSQKLHREPRELPRWSRCSPRV